jgi:hypothetical protein
MSHLQQESDAGHELPVYEHPPVYDELSASEEVSAPEELSAGEELSIFEELSVSEELPVSEDSPVTQELPLSEETVSKPPPVWLLRLLYLGCMLAVIGVCLIIFAAIMAVLPIIMEALKNLFSETNTCNGYTTTEWYRSGYAAGYTDALASASNTKNATIESRDLIDILTIVDIPSLSTKDVISEERNTAENELHTQEQREESPALTTLEIPDIPSKDSILEEGNRTEKELQLEGLEDITTREKKEEGLPPPYARVCEINTECPPGYRCLEASCVRGCDSTEDCPDKYHCKYGRYGYRCFEETGRHRECMEHGHFCRRHLQCCTGYCGRRSKGGDFLCSPKPEGMDGHAEGVEE